MNIEKKMFGIADCCSEDNTRYAIAGVRVTRDGDKVSLAATDGRKLLVASWKDGTPKIKRKDGLSVVIPPYAWKLAKKRISRKKGSASLRERSPKGTVEITSSGSIETTSASIEDARFPKVQDAIPEYKPGECVEIAFNPELLSGILKCIAQMKKGDDLPGVRLTIPHNPRRPLRIDALTDDGVKIVGVVMPVELKNLKFA